MSFQKHIFLYGPSGSGKTTLARLLAEALDIPSIDLDEEIESSSGQTIPQIFSTLGETEFRQLESRELRKVIEQPEAVIALGGGALLDPQNRRLAEANGEIVCLLAPYEVLLQRLEPEATSRPLLSGDSSDQLLAYLSNRQQHYRSFTISLDTGSLTTDQALKQIQLLSGRYQLKGMQPYQVRIIPGILENLAASLGERIKGKQLVLVTDDNIADIYQDWITQTRSKGWIDSFISLPAGEQSKSLSELNRLWDQFLALGVDRKSVIIALGGGVIGDLVGFAAATFMRGVRWINLPSTLLAQVDAAIGGKTGINLPQGKNLVGAFYPPHQVLIDPDFLTTLPDDEFVNGMAEVIKHAVIAGQPLLDLCRQGFQLDPAPRTALVRAAAAVKIQIVEQDPFESRLREVLNFGHTIGHAVEKISSYSLKHGQAVAIGMAVETYIAETSGIATAGLSAELNNLLRSNDLPTEIPAPIDTSSIINTLRFDKKNRGGSINFALPKSFANVVPGIKVENLDSLIDDYRRRKYR